MKIKICKELLKQLENYNEAYPNWGTLNYISCHGLGHPCEQHLVEVTYDERAMRSVHPDGSRKGSVEREGSDSDSSSKNVQKNVKKKVFKK